MSAKAGLVHTEDSRPRPEGYGAALKDHFTGAQKRRPASALQAYRENWPFEDFLKPEPDFVAPTGAAFTRAYIRSLLP